MKQESTSQDDEPSGKKKAASTKKIKKEKTSPKKEPKNEEEEGDEHKWWLSENLDDSVKWKTLQHNGPFFPPQYEPHGIKMKYNGMYKNITLRSNFLCSLKAKKLTWNQLQKKLRVSTLH